MSQSNRELLELAAKAYGLQHKGYERRGDREIGMRIDHANGMITLWNPLEDDGDALRLAMKLNLAITPYPVYATPKHSVIVGIKSLEPPYFEQIQIYDGDPCACTRRAIVRVAAEIGKANEPS